MEQVRCLARSRYVRLLGPGKSRSGREIPALVITDFGGGLEDKARVLICSGQHGTEYNPVLSVLSLSEEFASGERLDMLDKCVLIVVPMVNPDGLAAGDRLNAQGLDVNRDWLSLQTPEAAYVDGIVRMWKPHVLIDAHEWTERASVPENGIEVAQCVSPSQSEAIAELALRVERESGLIRIMCSPSADKSLFHRRYCLLGYAAFLLETALDESWEAKDLKYKSAIETLASAAADDPARAMALSPAVRRFDASAAMACLQAPPAPHITAATSTVVLGTLLMGGYSLFIWLIKPARRRERAPLGTLRTVRTLQPRPPQPETADYPRLTNPIPPPLTDAGSVRPLVKVRAIARRTAVGRRHNAEE